MLASNQPQYPITCSSRTLAATHSHVSTSRHYRCDHRSGRVAGRRSIHTGQVKAVVFNQGGDSVSVVDANTMQVAHVDVREDFNQMVMSQTNSQTVICYFDEAAVDPDDPITEGARSFNEVSLIHLQSLEHTPMVVGFNPETFDFPVMHPGPSLSVMRHLAVVNLSAETPSPNRIKSAMTPCIHQRQKRVLTPNGEQALIRQFDVTDLILVDLDNGTVVPN